MGGRVLMVSFHYPPSGGVGAHRPASFARHLPAFGWEPLLLSRVPDPRQPIDETLPSSPHPLRRLDPVEPSRLLGYLPAALREPLRRRLCVPDEEGGWGRGLRRAIPDLIAERRPDLLWANSVPLRTLVESCRAARAAGIPFVADFHNEWIRNPYYRPPDGRVDARNRELEAEVVEGARLVVTLNPMHTEDLRARFPRARVETIENGFEPRDAAPLPPGPPVFVYAGAVYGHQGPRPFLEALAGLGRTDVQVRIIGDRFGAFQPGSWPFPVTVTGHVPHAELSARLGAAGAGFLCLDVQASRQLPAKLYEYLGAGRPVFAIVPGDGAADRWIREHGAGVPVPVEEPSTWTPALKAFLDSLPSWKAPDASRFQRRTLTGRLAALLDEVRR